MEFISFLMTKDFSISMPPIITGSDAEGAGEMFRVTTLEFRKTAKERW
jgi:asparaginyl-tRNA synthetase